MHRRSGRTADTMATVEGIHVHAHAHIAPEFGTVHYPWASIRPRPASNLPRHNTAYNATCIRLPLSSILDGLASLRLPRANFLLPAPPWARRSRYVGTQTTELQPNTAKRKYPNLERRKLAEEGNESPAERVDKDDCHF